MDGIYPILLGGQAVGEAKVKREGLYLGFSCACALSGETVCKILVEQGGKTENLGIPIPQNGRFRLNTKIPAKRFGDGPLTFRAVPKHGDLGGEFVPLSPEEPFAYISRLEKAYLQRRGTQVGIVWKNDS